MGRQSIEDHTGGLIKPGPKIECHSLHMPLARQGAVTWPHLTAWTAGRWWSSWVPRRRRRDVTGVMKERNEAGDRE